MDPSFAVRRLASQALSARIVGNLAPNADILDANPIDESSNGDQAEDPVFPGST